MATLYIPPHLRDISDSNSSFSGRSNGRNGNNRTRRNKRSGRSNGSNWREQKNPRNNGTRRNGRSVSRNNTRTSNGPGRKNNISLAKKKHFEKKLLELKEEYYIEQDYTTIGKAKTYKDISDNWIKNSKFTYVGESKHTGKKATKNTPKNFLILDIS